MSLVSSAKSRRYLALWLPFLPADRLRRHEGGSTSPDDAPLVFVERVKDALRLAAADRRARRLGLAPGMTLADARIRIPALSAADMDRAADARFLDRVADFCDRYTPLVALDPPAGLILDITGCAHLFGGEGALRDDLLGRLDGQGIDVRAAIAGTPEGARAMVHFGTGTAMSGTRQADAVAGLPAAALGIAPETALALRRAGLKTVGDLAARPRAALAARFGSVLVDRLSRTLGEEDIRISPRRALPAALAERRFAEPIGEMDAALATLDSLAGRIARLLEQRGEGGRAFEAAFHRTDATVLRIAVQTARPVRDPATLSRLFRERLDALADPLDPGFGFDLVRLSVVAGEPFAGNQPGLHGQQSGDSGITGLIDRLGARLGIHAVARLVPADTHVPERAARAVPAAGLTPPAAPWPPPEAGEPPARPIHMFDPPQPIEALAEVPDGPPLRFRWRRALHEVARAEGPERIAPEWWRDDDATATRDYYRVEDARGRRFWIYREGLYAETPAPRWFLHGMFA